MRLLKLEIDASDSAMTADERRAVELLIELSDRQMERDHQRYRDERRRSLQDLLENPIGDASRVASEAW